MGRFLWVGGGFNGIISSFGRPAVRHWTGALFCLGRAVDEQPTVAIRHTEMLPLHTDPTDAVAAACELAREVARNPMVHSRTVAIDPTRWELLELVPGGASPVGVGYDQVYREFFICPGPHQSADECASV